MGYEVTKRTLTGEEVGQVGHNSKKKGCDKMTRRLMRKKEVEQAVGLKFPAIWRMMRAGTFPRARRQGSVPVWFEDDIEKYQEGLPEARYLGDPGGSDANAGAAQRRGGRRGRASA